MHAADAEVRGLADGQRVRVFNDRGRHECRLAVSRARRASSTARRLVAQARHRRHQRQRADEPAPDRHRRRADVLRLPGRGAGLLMRRGRAVVALALALAIGAASLSSVRAADLGYIAQSVGGHLGLLRAARPVPEWLADASDARSAARAPAPRRADARLRRRRTRAARQREAIAATRT